MNTIGKGVPLYEHNMYGSLLYMNTIGMKFWYEWLILATNALTRLCEPTRAFDACIHKEYVEIKPKTKFRSLA